MGPGLLTILFAACAFATASNFDDRDLRGQRGIDRPIVWTGNRHVNTQPVARRRDYRSFPSDPVRSYSSYQNDGPVTIHHASVPPRICNECPRGYVPADTRTCRCVPVYQPQAVQRCPRGQYLSGGVCTRIVPPRVVSCSYGYILVRGQCEATPPPPIVCPAGLVVIDAKCQLNPSWGVPVRKYCPNCYCSGPSCPCDNCHGTQQQQQRQDDNYYGRSYWTRP